MFSDDTWSELNGAKSLAEPDGKDDKDSSSYETNMMFSLEDETQCNSNENEEGVQQKLNLIKLPVRKSQVLPQSSQTAEFALCKESLLSSESSCHSNEGDGKYPLIKAINERNQTPSANNSIGNSTQNNGYLYQCTIRGCPIMKPLEEDLFEHVRIDHADRKHRCDICPNAFKFPNQLSKHSLVHSGDKPHQCDECGMKFTLQLSLKRHQYSIHNEKKLASCRQHTMLRRFGLIFEHFIQKTNF